MAEKKEKLTVYDKLSEEQKREPMPYYQHEIEMARISLQSKRWFIAFLIVLFLFVGTNAGWIIYESSFETYSVDQEVDTGNGDAYVAGVGDVNYGENQADNQSQSQTGCSE